MRSSDYDKAFQSKIETEHSSAYTMSRGRNKRIQGTNAAVDDSEAAIGVGRRNVIFHLKMVAADPICLGINSCGMAGAGAGVLRVLFLLEMYNNLSDEGAYLG